ncbi:hypothetical protein GPL17_10955 [Bradyrhizobium yuanmingense]|uniref:hypothetical protein n=1 Tax=Bradyrhizobium yuanmingense TaxID=108015 RepID=UPI0012FC0F0F|nr:hypothetical protein [Bradyrhizobium yuanmingense]MVT51010.1 hypothetical protein [Bradyrhizobium yuanmingense]
MLGLPQTLEREITESVFLAHAEENLKTLQRFLRAADRAEGKVRVAAADQHLELILRAVR